MTVVVPSVLEVCQIEELDDARACRRNTFLTHPSDDSPQQDFNVLFHTSPIFAATTLGDEHSKIARVTPADRLTIVRPTP